MKRSILPITLSLLLAAFSAVGCSGCGKGGASSDKFTYNTYLETNPKTWNVHTWETSDESYVPAFTEIGLYDLQLNATKDGYEIVTEMAAAMPVDVTSTITDDEIAKYGYEGNPVEGSVWDIELNQAAVWEDGKPINADTYVESMKRQLDPKMVNYRADSYYAAGFVIANAEGYFKQHRETIEPAFNYINTDGTYTDENFASNGTFYLNLATEGPYGGSIFSGGDPVSLYTVLRQVDEASDAVKLAAARVKDAACYFCWKYVDHNGKADYTKWQEIDTLKKALNADEDMLNTNINLDDLDNKDVYVRPTLTEPTSEAECVKYSSNEFKTDIKKVIGFFPHDARGGKDLAWKLPLFAEKYNPDTVDFDNVGIKKMSDYKMRLYLAQPITELDLKFSLSGSWIVDVDLYDSLKVVTAGGLVQTTYATPTGWTQKDHGYKSYGPYKLTAYEDGKSFTIENDKWYGYSDGKHEGQYQMTGVYTRIIGEHQTARQEFEKGNLDDFGLNRTDMKDYGESRRRTQTYESYTTKISFNSDRAKLLSRQKAAGSVNKTILANYNFRKGISLGINRNTFAAQTTAGSKGFTGLLNDLYLSDVETGEMYRNSSQGKSVYNMVYSNEGGNPYDPGYTPSALSEDACGYNFNMAVKYIADAFTEEFASDAEGHLTPTSKISLDFPVYDDQSETTIDMLNFLRQEFEKVVAAANEKAGSSVTIEIKSLKDEDYYTTARKGDTDMIFSTWGGAAIAPINLMQVYCDSTFDNCCEYGFKGKQNETMLDIEIDGEIRTKSFNAWWTEIENLTENKSDPDYEKIHKYRLTVLAGLEAGILNRFEAIPIYARASSSLNSFKIENGSPTYINLIGYGGIRHLSFNYNDAEWEQFLEENGHNLSDLYKG